MPLPSNLEHLVYSNKKDCEPPDRVKNSPLANLNPPLPSQPKPLNTLVVPTFPTSPLSSRSYKTMRKELAAVVNRVVTYDLTSIEWVCRVMIDELNNLQSAARCTSNGQGGAEYLIWMQEDL